MMTRTSKTYLIGTPIITAIYLLIFFFVDLPIGKGGSPLFTTKPDPLWFHLAMYVLYSPPNMVIRALPIDTVAVSIAVYTLFGILWSIVGIWGSRGLACAIKRKAQPNVAPLPGGPQTDHSEGDR